MFFKPIYIFILFFTIIIDYYAGLLIARTDDIKKRKRYLILSLVANIGVLFVFKYFNFFNANITSLCELLGCNNNIPFVSIMLPIGLSFHTFQAMSYTIEVYRGNQKPEKHFGIYSLYVMFYPQLVAGPIERPQNVLHQFHEKKVFKYDLCIDGLRLMLWGFVKKTVVADNVGVIADNVFNDPNSQNSLTIIIGALFFTVQIYCDFSGYSDIALGSAKIMGFDLMKNFNLPYFSESIKQFWTRWHISLSSWFRDYLYIPLGGNRVSKLKNYINVFIVFLVSGFWHGASWNFVLWGAIHGIYVSIQTFTESFKIQTKSIQFPNFKKFFKITFTFVIVLFAWIIFRVANFSHLKYFISKLFFGWKEVILLRHQDNLILKGLKIDNTSVLLLLLLLVIAFFCTEKLMTMFKVRDFFHKYSSVRLLTYFSALMLILCFSYLNETQFIYFQF